MKFRESGRIFAVEQRPRTRDSAREERPALAPGRRSPVAKSPNANVIASPDRLSSLPSGLPWTLSERLLRLRGPIDSPPNIHVPMLMGLTPFTYIGGHCGARCATMLWSLSCATLDWWILRRSRVLVFLLTITLKRAQVCGVNGGGSHRKSPCRSLR